MQNVYFESIDSLLLIDQTLIQSVFITAVECAVKEQLHWGNTDFPHSMIDLQQPACSAEGGAGDEGILEAT